MGQQDLLKAVVSALEAEGATYALTGSIASSLLGEPRTTHDIDFVVAILPEQVARLAARFPGPRFLLDVDAACEAIATGKQFNLLDSEAGEKVDFWLHVEEPFSRSCMERRRSMSVFGLPMWVLSPEDLILSKLKWARLSGGSDRQMRDALGVYEVQGPDLDDSYLDEWAGRIGVAELLAQLRAEAKLLQ